MTNELEKRLSELRRNPMDAYMERLRRQTAERNARRQAEAAVSLVDPLAALKERVRDWWRRLSPDARADFYYMADLQRLIGAAPQALGLALSSLSWERRRAWVKNESYRQRWYPPAEWLEPKEAE